jgi:hypothetical protein
MNIHLLILLDKIKRLVQLDIWIPDFNLAIEYQGYYHVFYLKLQSSFSKTFNFPHKKSLFLKNLIVTCNSLSVVCNITLVS